MLNQSTSTARAALFAAIVMMALEPTARAAAPEPANHASVCFEPVQWVGKYAGQKTASGPRFIDLPCIRAPLQALLPAPELRRLLAASRVDGPIRMVGRYLVVARCEAHNCPSEHEMIAVDLERGTLFVGFYRQWTNGSVSSWYSNGRDPVELPPEIPQQFLRQHTPSL